MKAHLYTMCLVHEENRYLTLVAKSVLNLARIGQELDAKKNRQVDMARARVEQVSSENPCAEVHRLEVRTTRYRADIQGALEPLSVNLPVTYLLVGVIPLPGQDSIAR
jgi:hypothetical protein